MRQKMPQNVETSQKWVCLYRAKIGLNGMGYWNRITLFSLVREDKEKILFSKCLF